MKFHHFKLCFFNPIILHAVSKLKSSQMDKLVSCQADQMKQEGIVGYRKFSAFGYVFQGAHKNRVRSSSPLMEKLFNY